MWESRVKKKRAEEYKQHNTKSLYNKSHPGLTALFDSRLEIHSGFSSQLPWRTALERHSAANNVYVNSVHGTVKFLND